MGWKSFTHYMSLVFTELLENEKKESEIAEEEMLFEILYFEKWYEARFSDLKKRVENEYVLNKADYTRTVTAMQILL